MPRSTLTPIPYTLLVLVGPTASGKSELAVSLAKKYNGEIISADSRQIYKGMDLGTGKVTGKWKNGKYIYKGIPHHLIDFLNPKTQYSAGSFQKEAKKTIVDVLKRGKLPIICGGTAHWIDAVVYNQTFPEVKPNKTLRAKLDKKSAEVLFKQLQKLDPARAKTIDRFNKHRLIRALEIVLITGKPVPTLYPTPLPTGQAGSTLHPTLWLGINPSQKVLYKKIEVRFKQRLKAGMIKEVSKLQQSGVSWKRLESFGLEYKFISLFLQKKLTREEMETKLLFAIKHYAKRQMTWWKRNKEIKWFSDADKALKSIEKILK